MTGSNMENSEVSNRDHNYSAVKSNTSPVVLGDDTFGRIKDISELRKISPRIRILSCDANTLNELAKIKSNNSPHGQSRLLVLEQTRQELRKCCRTCAGLKFPLVDMYSKQGMRMKLSKKIQHLEKIKPDDSLPTQMCINCIYYLKMSYRFFKQIKRAESKLKSIHALYQITLANISAKKELIRKGLTRDVATSTKDLQMGLVNPMNCSLTSTQSTTALSTCVQSTFVQSTCTQSICSSTSAKHNKQIPYPKISAVFSLKDLVQSAKQIEAIQNEARMKAKPEVIKGKATQVNTDSNDNALFQPDSSTATKSDEDLNSVPLQVQGNVDKQKQETIVKRCSEPIFICIDDSIPDSTALGINKTVYKFDKVLNAYVKLQSTDGDTRTTELQLTLKSQVTDNNESTKNPMEQLNIPKHTFVPQKEKVQEKNKDVIMGTNATIDDTKKITVSPKIMTEEMMRKEILQLGAVVYLQRADDSGKIQMVQVMLAVPQKCAANTETSFGTTGTLSTKNNN